LKKPKKRFFNPKMEKVLNKLIKEIITTEELNSILLEIDKIQREVFEKQNGSLSKIAKELENHQLENYLLELEKIYPKNPEEQFSSLEKLKKNLQIISQIRIQIAYPVSKAFLKNIVSWIEKETHKKLILDIILNPKIVGGAIIEYQGKYENFSLEKEIDKIIREKQI